MGKRAGKVESVVQRRQTAGNQESITINPVPLESPELKNNLLVHLTLRLSLTQFLGDLLRLTSRVETGVAGFKARRNVTSSSSQLHWLSSGLSEQG